MAAKGGFPSWLLDGKERISSSQDWKAFVAELHEVIQQQLTESHVQQFTDLSDAEKTLFMERAAMALQGGQAYDALYAKVSLTMDQCLSNEIARELLEESPINTKTDLILNNAKEGSVGILKKWPDLKSKLHVCFNQSLPWALRHIVWRLFLSSTKARKEYVDILSTNPRAAMSELDLEISQKCENLLNSETTVEELRGSVGAFYGMKAVLSYYHSRKQSRVSLTDIEYMLMLPLIYTASKSISRRDPPPSHVVAMLVEEYISLMESRPGYVVDSGSDIHDEEMKSFTFKVAQIIQERDSDLAIKLGQACIPSEKIITTEAARQSVFEEGLTTLVRPCIKALFVGFLNIDTVLYIWDQYIIGLDVPGYHTECLPVFTVVYLMLLKDQLMRCDDISAMETVLKEGSRNIKTSQFQYLVNRFFYRDLYGLLNKDEKTGLPVLDPTQTKYPPWHHWSKGRIPSHTTAETRRLAREQREYERERLLQQQREADDKRRDAEEQQRRDAEYQNKRRAAADLEKVDEEKLYLENLLDEERRRREESERRAAAEIERLQKEIEAMKGRKFKSPAPSVFSLRSVISYLIPAPPPSRASGAVTKFNILPPPRSPTPHDPEKVQAQRIMLDILGKVQQTIFKISQGDSKEAADLDKESREALKNHRNDFKFAEKQVFGRELRPGEFDSLPEDEKEKKSEEMMGVIKERIEGRRKAALNKKK
ncbi:uncharacterized protein LOC106153737 [Lingula anatina]|uniref:Uncharacterized protein LOC106153737 n=1 Tax=Lingula anatina TaxID=7574 RepID=A0A1S3HB64_LINAN|nr:uncharacterized protein LOC106153737 [Lingula anatina]|eukprot:XP_013383272.1 uncharacterized protein LOC106153737 [Lingula anatina]